MAEPTDLKLTITADVGQANKALDQLEKDAKSAGNAASVSLGKIESLLESINTAAQSAAGSLGKPFAAANPEIQKYAANIQKLEKQVSSLQSQLDKLAKTPAPKPPEGPDANAIRAKWDPLFAISQKYKENLTEIAAAEKAGTITTAIANNARQDAANIANTQMEATKRLTAGMGGLNHATQLTSNQLLNLSRQGNDALTMLASGSGIFQVVATQAGQVFGALEEGPQGLKGSMEAIKQYAINAAAAIGPMNLAFGAAAIAAGGLLIALKRDVEPTEDIIKRQAASVKRLTEEYNLVAPAAEAAGRRSRAAMNFEIGGQTKKDLFNLQQMAFDMASLPGVNSLFNQRNRTYEAAAPIRKALEDLQSTARSGVPDFVAYRDALTRIAQSDAPANVKELAKFLLTSSEEAEKARRSYLGVADALSETVTRSNEAKQKLAELQREFGAFAPDDRSDAQKIHDNYTKQIAAINQIVADNPRVVAGLASAAAQQANTALDKLAEGAKQKQVETAEALANVGLAPLEKAIAETTQRYNAEIAEYLKTKGDAAGANALEAAKLNEIARLRKEAGIAATEEANKVKEAADERLASINKDVALLRSRVETFSQTEGAAAAYEYRLRALDEAQRAVGANKVIPETERQAIEAAAAQVGQYTDELKRLNAEKEKSKRLSEFEADLAFGAQIRGLSREDQAIAEKLRSLGVDYLSVQGQQYAAQMRFNDALKDTKDKAIDFQDVGQSIFDTLNDSLAKGDSLLKGLANTFAKLANQLASQAFGKLFGGLFNPGQSTGVGGQGPSVSSVITSAGNLVAGANPSRQSSASFVGAPVGAVQRAALPALGSSSSNSLADSIRNAANTLKISARDLATVISYETGGTFDPWKKGPTTKWGQHIGLIQMGGPQRAANGYAQGNTIDQNMAAVVKYLKSAGVKPGHGLLELYSSINAGGIGEKYFNRSDSHVGGAPGTVRDKVNYQMEGHKANADRLLGKTAVSEGFIDAQKKIANGQAGVANVPIPTARPSSNIPIPTARPTNGAGGGLLSGTNGWTGAGSILGVQYPAFSAMGGISAGLGGFGSGYSSGSPISGGLTGGLSGFMAGGPIGGLIGLGAGILGGILGGRAQRKQKHMDAAARWEELRPQYEAFDKSLSGDGNGQLRQWITSQKGQLDQFMKVGGEAWKYGTGNSTAQFASTGTKMYQKFMEMMGEYREGFTDMIEDLTSGEGLGGAFAKGRAAAKDLKQQIKDMIDDVSIAFISNDIGVPTSAEWEAESKRVEEQRNTAIQQAKEAAGEYALTMLYTSKTTSDVAKSIDGFRGTAAGLQKVLVELGWTAEEAAKDIDDRLKQALADMAKTFTEGFQNEINDLSGVGYFNDIAELFKSRETGVNDAKLLGVDPAIVTKWFTLAVQNVVDGAELTGDAFNELIKKFPELSGVVKDFAESASGAKMTIKEINEALNNAAVSRYDQAIRERSDAEADLRSEYERTKKSIADIKSFLSDMRISEETSLLSGQDRFSEAQKLYRETLAKANSGDVEAQEELLNVTQEYLDEAKAYYASSEQYAEVYKEIESSLNDVVVKSQSQLDYVKSQTNALFDIVTNTKNLTQLLDDYLKKNSAVGGSLSQLDSTRSWGVRPVANKKNVAEFRAAGLPEYTGNFGPDTWPQIQAWLDTLTVEQRDKAMAIMTANNAIGYATGGLVMNGQWNRDSVMAKLAGGEHITRAPSVNNGTRSMLDYINRTGMLPGANDNGRMDGVERRLDRVIQTLATGFNMSVQAIETGNGLTEAQNANAKLMNSR